MDYRSTLDTLFMDCVQHLADQIEKNIPAENFPMKEAMIKHFGSKEKGLYFWKKWTDVQNSLVKDSPEEAQAFLWIMKRRWSSPWHGEKNPHNNNNNKPCCK